MTQQPTKADLQFRRGTADSYPARHLPFGAEQDISADLIEAVFAESRSSAPFLTLSSADSDEIELLAPVSQATVPVTAFIDDPRGDIIEAATATMVDSAVLPNEEVVISGDQAGTFTTSQVINNEKVRVIEKTITEDAAPTATITINRGDGWFRVKIDSGSMAAIWAAVGDADTGRGTGAIIHYRTPSGEPDRQFLEELCFEILDTPQ